MLLIEYLPRKMRYLLTVSGKFDFLYRHNLQFVALVVLGLSGGHQQAEEDADQMNHLGYNNAGHFAPEFVQQEESSLQDLLECQ